MDMRIPPLTLKILLESDPLTSRILVRRLAVASPGREIQLAPGGGELGQMRRARDRQTPDADEDWGRGDGDGGRHFVNP